MVAFDPSVTFNPAGKLIFGKQNVPLPVWLKAGTSSIDRLVTLLPMPRLTNVCALGCVGVKTRAPPSSGQAVRFVSLIDWFTPPPVKWASQFF